MPRRSKTLPNYRKHKASGQAVVTLSGRDHYLGPYGSDASKVEYDRLIAEWLAAGRVNVACASEAGPTVAEVMVAYLRYAKTRYVKNGLPTSEQDLIRSALRPLRDLYSKEPASKFGPLALKAVRGRLIDAGMARRTINQHVGRIIRMFKWAAEEEMLSASIYQTLKAVDSLRKGQSKAKESTPVLPANENDVEATLKFLTPVVADMVRLQRLTGMRPGEVCTMRPCDVDRTGGIWSYCPESHKTEHHGRGRLIHIGPKGQQILSPYLMNREPADYCFSPKDSEQHRNAARRASRATPMTPSQEKRKPKRHRDRAPGNSYPPNSYRIAIRRACVKANVPIWQPNQLRHSAATDIRQRFGLEAAQVTLGHSKADVTQIYAERDTARARQVAAAIG